MLPEVHDRQRVIVIANTPNEERQIISHHEDVLSNIVLVGIQTHREKTGSGRKTMPKKSKPRWLLCKEMYQFLDKLCADKPVNSQERGEKSNEIDDDL